MRNRIESVSFKTIQNYTYNLRKKLGEGSQGSVFVGQKISGKKPIAAKVINQSKLRSDIDVYLLHCELDAYKILNHPHILKVYDIFREGGYCYIFSELCQGGNLKQSIKKREKITESDSLFIFQGILDGLTHILKTKIFHRDLKSTNIMLKKDNFPIIIDFGLCDFIESSQRPKDQYLVGSTQYMSPEVYNRKQFNEKSDIWSLGVILHEMVTGSTLKIKTKNVDKYFKDLLKKQYPEIKEKFENEIILKLLKMCLCVKIEKRATVSQLKQVLVQWSKRRKQ